jgi:hypothetical protein
MKKVANVFIEKEPAQISLSGSNPKDSVNHGTLQQS